MRFRTILQFLGLIEAIPKLWKIGYSNENDTKVNYLDKRAQQKSVVNELAFRIVSSDPLTMVCHVRKWQMKYGFQIDLEEF